MFQCVRHCGQNAWTIILYQCIHSKGFEAIHSSSTGQICLISPPGAGAASLASKATIVVCKISRLWPGRHTPERMKPWLMSRLTSSCANAAPTAGSPSSRRCLNRRSVPGARAASGTRPGCARPRPTPTATTQPWPAGRHNRGRHRRLPRANPSLSLCYTPQTVSAAQCPPDCGLLHPANAAERLAALAGAGATAK